MLSPLRPALLPTSAGPLAIAAPPFAAPAAFAEAASSRSPRAGPLPPCPPASPRAPAPGRQRRFRTRIDWAASPVPGARSRCPAPQPREANESAPAPRRAKRSLIGLLDAREDAHQGRFGGTVFADWHVDPASIQTEVHSLKSDVAPVPPLHLPGLRITSSSLMQALRKRTAQAPPRAASPGSVLRVPPASTVARSGPSCRPPGERRRGRKIREPAKRQRTQRGYLLLSRPQYRDAQQVGLQLHQRRVTRRATIGQQDRRIVRNARHGKKHFRDLECDRLHRRPRQMCARLLALRPPAPDLHVHLRRSTMPSCGDDLLHA